MMAQKKLPIQFFENRDIVRSRCAAREIFLFLDYDGTLTPIVDTPDLAVLSDAMRQAVRAAARVMTVSIVSGRATDDVRGKVALEGLFYAGSHGFEIVDPQTRVTIHPQAQKIRQTIDGVYEVLSDKLKRVPGALVEHVKYTISVHYRLVSDDNIPAVEREVAAILQGHPDLRKTDGKKVFEIRPNIPWDKGKAVDWILQTLQFDPRRHIAVYIGDDTTDEDAFEALGEQGVGILVADSPYPSFAEYWIADTEDVKKSLKLLMSLCPKNRKPL